MEVIKFDLGTRMIDCPNYWANFISYININPNNDVPMRVIQRELKKFNARYRLSGSSSCDYIEFQSEKDLIFFILRWS